MKALYIVFCSLFISFISNSQTPTVAFSSIATGLTAPVDIVNAKDNSNRLFIVQQNGIVRIYSGGSLLAGSFLNMSSLILYSGEQGLLSLAFHPQYATNGYFYVYYNNPSGAVELAQYHVSADPNVADAASRKVMLTIPKPFSNHNGGKLNFGPDGNLYLSIGDGGSGGDPNNNAQNLNSYLGKILRINVDNFTVAPYYTVPPTNPLVGMAGTKPEIYHWGLRNPWRWTFDRTTGDMWIADVGQSAWEEINMISSPVPAGLNFGWRCYEGNHSYDLSLCGATPASGKTFPVFEYAHNAAGGYSVSGGVVYRGTEYPALQGYYFFADYVRPNGWMIKPDGAGGYTVLTQSNYPSNVTTFGDAEDGTLYLATLSGTVYRVFQSNVVSNALQAFEAKAIGDKDVLTWQINAGTGISSFDIEQSVQGTQFYTIGSITANGNSNYSFTTPALNGERYYRLRMNFATGATQYSPVRKIISTGNNDLMITYSGAKQIQLHNTITIENVILLDITGRKIISLGDLPIGTHELPVSKFPAGLYFLQGIKKADHRKIAIKISVF